MTFKIGINIFINQKNLTLNFYFVLKIKSVHFMNGLCKYQTEDSKTLAKRIIVKVLIFC